MLIPTSDVSSVINTGVTLKDIKAQLASQKCLPVGGRLQHFWERWKELGAPNRVVRWLKRGYPLPFRKPVQKSQSQVLMTSGAPDDIITDYRRDKEKAAALKEMITKLVQKQAVESVPPGELGHYSRVFLRAKRTGGWRLIIDLKPLNALLDTPSFKMDTCHHIRQAIEPGMWATSIDLSDAYFHIPIKQTHRKYLCFQIGDQKLRYRALPFGLSPAPWVFTKTMKPLKTWGRKLLMLLFQYLDDWFNTGRDREILAQQTLQLIDKCIKLGLLVNLEKSEIIPKQIIIFLGDKFDFRKGMMFPSEERLVKIHQLIQALLTMKVVKLHAAESLLGLLIATEKAVPWGRLNLRCFQKAVKAAVRRGRHRDASLSLSKKDRYDLIWWRTRHNTLKGCPFVPPHPDIQMQTDASTSGWGAHCEGTIAQGKWTAQEGELHINVLEMLAIHRTLQQIGDMLKGKTVLTLIDNSTTVSYIKKQGGTRSWELMAATKSVFELAQKLKITIIPHHIPGQLNALADMASRAGQIIASEWTLSKTMFNWVVTQSAIGPPKVDLFATRFNNQLTQYMSPCPDPQASQIDALSSPWPKLTLYAYPPTTILTKVIERMATEPSFKMLLIAPAPTEATWYPTLQRWTTCRPLMLPMRRGDLRQPHWQYEHQKPMLLALHLWQLEKWSG